MTRPVLIGALTALLGLAHEGSAQLVPETAHGSVVELRIHPDAVRLDGQGVVVLPRSSLGALTLRNLGADQVTAADLPDLESGARVHRIEVSQRSPQYRVTSGRILFQGDDIGTEGGPDPDNRAMQRFDALSTDEQACLENVQAAGLAREANAPVSGLDGDEVLDVG